MSKFIIFCLVVLGLFYFINYLPGCGFKPGKNFTGLEYMPDMGHSRAYDVYYPSPGTESEIELEVPDEQRIKNPVFKNGMVARKPVPGTIARGFKPYPYVNTEAGYENSVGLLNPYWDADFSILAEGQGHYAVYCQVCHGPAGEGAGSISVVNGGPFGGIPNYFGAAYMTMPEGKMFHSVHYGKNDMGSYASQLTKDERWKVVAYVKSLQAKKVEKEYGSYEAALQYVRGTAVGLGPLSPDGMPLSSKLSGIKNKALTKGQNIILNNVFFASGSADLDAASNYELGILAQILKKNKSAKVEISGHTDSDGDYETNLQLSERRSRAAYDYLRSQGISDKQIGFKGYGPDQPVASNETDEGKQQNRRVEFKVLDI